MSYHHHRNPSQSSHRTMSAEERCSTPVHHHKASTPTHKSASSSSSYQRDTRQVSGARLQTDRARHSPLLWEQCSGVIHSIGLP